MTSQSNSLIIFIHFYLFRWSATKNASGKFDDCDVWEWWANELTEKFSDCEPWHRSANQIHGFPLMTSMTRNDSPMQFSDKFQWSSRLVMTDQWTSSEYSVTLNNGNDWPIKIMDWIKCRKTFPITSWCNSWTQFNVWMQIWFVPIAINTQNSMTLYGCDDQWIKFIGWNSTTMTFANQFKIFSRKMTENLMTHWCSSEPHGHSLHSSYWMTSDLLRLPANQKASNKFDDLDPREW